GPALAPKMPPQRILWYSSWWSRWAFDCGNGLAAAEKLPLQRFPVISSSRKTTNFY
ncbi:hypothetical protein HAX54_036566, partial [Datura stramonium]|nr:hypothetical protein [Datura stramonium]